MTNRNKWTEAENLELLRRRDELHLKWDAIDMPGRTSGACQVQYYAVLKDRNAAKKLHRSPWVREPRQVSQCISFGRVSSAPPQGLPVVAGAPGPYRPARHVSTSVLIADADLRGRIATQGLTAGLFGDPPPGRSALDQKRGAT
jgi:hypothetical protein